MLDQQCPEISFKTTNQQMKQFKDFSGQWLVLYFYPKDATPGCTLEAQSFRDHYQIFNALNTKILGVSRDSLSSHEKFKTKQMLPYELISDEDEKICQFFDVIKMKSMYGKSVRGIERSTFLIDCKGVIRHEWRKVNVKNHIEDVINQLKALQQQDQ